MGNRTIREKKQSTDQIFDDLDAYLNFCRTYGYKFREPDLYNMRIYPYQQFQKKLNGKNFKDQLGVDLARQYR